MTARERVLSALARRPTDRTPRLLYEEAIGYTPAFDCNSNVRGYDIYKDIQLPGKRICEFHAKQTSTLLGQGKVDFQKVREAIDAIGYTWIQIEGGVPPGKPMLESCQTNCRFPRGIFNA